MQSHSNNTEAAPVPEILAPAGSRQSFLAALDAGADAIYCGLKQFSARMEAKNFRFEELTALTRLAHEAGSKVYIALNTMLHPHELDPAGQALAFLRRDVAPDALIIQDLAVAELARQVGFSGEIHLSTLANVSFPAALSALRRAADADRVVLPRELSIDEIKAMARACPPDLGLEVFVHGALCYGVSGRCYWSSFLGGKSGLRGRCVQPCRRRYTQSDKTERYFSCQDLSVDVLAKLLNAVPQIRAWKIEGRKKGPHYVYHTVRAYRIFRDHGKDPKAKKEALALLDYALGRPGTHYNLLPQRPQAPVSRHGRTGSGLLIGKVQGDRRRPFLVPREALLSGDALRIGFEDDPWHTLFRVSRGVPKKGRLVLKLRSGRPAPAGTPVFLTDRREPWLKERLAAYENKLGTLSHLPENAPPFRARLPRGNRKIPKSADLHIFRSAAKGRPREQSGFWVPDAGKNEIFPGNPSKAWWVLPPVVFPDGEDGVRKTLNGILKKGGKNFILNAPWQVALFDPVRKLNLWAGPFCNLANSLALASLKATGFSGAVVSPELSKEGYLELPKRSPLPLGIVITALWPLCVSRTVSEDLTIGKSFKSPRGEAGFAVRHGADYWVYPNWNLDLTDHRKTLEKAGYSLFVHFHERLPKGVELKKRPGLWNWDIEAR